MTKRKRRFFRTLRFYNQDLFGRLVLKDPTNRNSLQLGFKNCKINNFLYDKFGEKFEKKRHFRAGKERFFYRIDKIKLNRKRRKFTRFAKQLRARLVIRKFATQMTVRQFRGYIKRASLSKFFILNFFKMIETRLDAVVFRLNMSETSSEIRQLINHGFIIVNGCVCTFHNLRLNFNDIVSVIKKQFWKEKILKMFLGKKVTRSIPSYLEVNFRILSAIVVFYPKTRQIVYPVKVRSNLLISAGEKFI